jgi:small membrane protein
MNLFQSLVLLLFVVLAVLTIAAGFGGAVRKRIVAFWLAVWALGATTIIWPHFTAVAAHSLGIGRGADLLLYLSVLVMFVAFFYVYTRFRKLDRELTLLVRRLAIQNAGMALPPTAASESAAAPSAPK